VVDAARIYLELILRMRGGGGGGGDDDDDESESDGACMYRTLLLPILL
jgi:hypothetical protein